MPEATEPRWLLLIHQIPPRPAYLRVKVGRRLQGLGAVPIKNSVYVLPRSEQALEDFQWVRREIVAGHGDATVCEARFVEGHSDTDVEALFTTARDAEYASLAEDARRLERALIGSKRRAPIGARRNPGGRVAAAEVTLPVQDRRWPSGESGRRPNRATSRGESRSTT